MIKRKLEKQVELTGDENQMLFKFPIKLEYYLLESEMDESEELKGRKTFGIEVIKKTQGNSDEIKSFTNVSCSMENTQNLLNKLAANSVTPMGMSYVLDDILGI
jgi:hypothetical protein